MKRLARDYVIAYADCYRWLYRVCPPWRWLLSLGLWPGSRMWHAVNDAASAARLP